jgi:hypothetical protein
LIFFEGKEQRFNQHFFEATLKKEGIGGKFLRLFTAKILRIIMVKKG